MILGIPITIWLGFMTIISLFTTATLGLLTLRGKVKFKYHKFFAFLTVSLAIFHGILAFLLWFFGIVI